jgi:hypothetical protein
MSGENRGSLSLNAQQKSGEISTSSYAFDGFQSSDEALTVRVSQGEVAS